MASNLPEKLRSGDILRYTQRAAQLEKFKPPVAYWCYYWVVNQILSKNLHQADEDCMNYTTQLVDKLEQFKVQYPGDPAISDDAAGQACIEQFGLETFQRAESAVRANKASKQTAETFQAAATFLELVQIWGPPSPDIAAQIKYAKYHALRIARALKAGEDPNLSNPPPPEDAFINPQPEVRLDPNDPDVQMINDAAAGQSVEGDKQPSFVEVPDEQDIIQGRLARQSNINESIHPSRASSLPRPPAPMAMPLTPGSGVGLDTAPDLARPLDEMPPPIDTSSSMTPRQGGTGAGGYVMPGVPPDISRQDSIGGGYFPQVASPHMAPGEDENEDQYQSSSFKHMLQSPDSSSPAAPTFSGGAQAFPSDFYKAAAPSTTTYPPSYSPTTPRPGGESSLQPTAPPFSPAFAPSPAAPFNPPIPRQEYPPPRAPAAPSTYAQQQQYQQPPKQTQQQQVVGPQNYLTDDDAVMKAQKHAKWAVSALNFEDVPTAVKELREALRSLGAW